MVSKTREKLIEVARQLFVYKGLENTTMNDIANASDKGRRTIYTYFKNKKEIYDAIIESDSEKMVSDLKKIVDSGIPTDQKLRDFLRLRLELGLTLRSQSFSLKSLLKYDRRRTERMRQLAYDKLSAMFGGLLDEGIRNGLFDPARCDMVRSFTETVIHALDLAEIDTEQHDEYRKANDALADFIVSGITSTSKELQPKSINNPL